MNAEQALEHLATSTQEAVLERLRSFHSGVQAGPVRVVDQGESPFDDVNIPSIAADVSYVDGVTGGNVLICTIEGARRMAAAMMGMDPTEVPDGGELSELERSAVGEAMNQMMSAAAVATGDVLGEEVEIAPPEIFDINKPEDLTDRWDHPGRATVVPFTFAGAPMALIQLVPNAFIVRMTRALDERTEEHHGGAPLSGALRDVRVRVWAELGRTRAESGRIVSLPVGAVVELDRAADAPIDLYADGMRFAVGRLIVTDDGGLAVRVDELVGSSSPRSEPNLTEVTA